MFQSFSVLSVQPYIALLIGFIFFAFIFSLYSNDFSLSQYKKSLSHLRKSTGVSLKKFFKNFVKVIKGSYQFFAGAVFAVLVFIAVTLLTGGTLPQIPPVVDSLATAIGTHTATRTTIDTSKPWIYDFSTLPNGPIDTKIFNVENGPENAGYNEELNTFTNRTSNVRVEDGALVFEAKPENKDGKGYTSGRVDTNGSFSFIYGSLEVEAKLPRGVGTWPAGWLMPSIPRYLATDFPSATDQHRLYSLNGELDFLESVGYIPGQNIPASHSYNSLAEPDQYTPAFTANPYDEYHKYGIIKTPTAIKFTIDGKVYAQRHKTSDSPLSWPYEQHYYLILNLSIGGVWAGKHGVDDSSAPWQYKIKSINYTPLSDIR